MQSNAITDIFTANPVLVDASQVAVVNASLRAFDEPHGKALLADQMNDQDSYWTWGHGDECRAHPYRPYVVTGGILQVPIQGTLLNKFDYQYGRWATGYQYIEKAIMRGLADPEVRGIALIVDSPGGEVSGCFELCDKIFEWRSEKPIRAFASDSAYSAAYALASSASELSVTRSGGTGSIGVVTMHVSYADALKEWGMEVTFVFAGKHKVEGNPYEKLSDAAKARIQVRIDKLYGVFTSTVARNRNLEEEAVRETEAMTFDAEDSVENGFADRVGSLDNQMVAFSEDTAPTSEGNQMTQFTQAQLDAAVTAAVATATTESAAANATALASATEAGVKLEQDRRTAIMGDANAADRPALAATLVESNTSAEMAAAILAGAPVEAKAEEPKPKADAGTGTPFENHMSNTAQPEVGADGPGAGDATADEKATASIVGAARAFKGTTA